MDAMTRTDIDKGLTTLRLIVALMAGGVIAFTGVIAGLVANGSITPAASQGDVMLVVLLAATVSTAVMYPVVRAQMIRQAQMRLREEAAASRGGGAAAQAAWQASMPGYFSVTLIGAAMAEGAGFFGVIILMTSGTWIALLAPGVALLALAALFPTRERLRSFASAVAGRALEDPPAS